MIIRTSPVGRTPTEPTQLWRPKYDYTVRTIGEFVTSASPKKDGDLNQVARHHIYNIILYDTHKNRQGGEAKIKGRVVNQIDADTY